VQFTVRRMVVAVALVAIPLGATVELKRRSDHFRRLAEGHRQKAIAGWMASRPDGSRGGFYYDRTGMPIPDWERHLLRDAWHARLKDKYYQASRRPWFPVPPDPPEPK
jgi:hypothetical protein